MFQKNIKFVSGSRNGYWKEGRIDLFVDSRFPIMGTMGEGEGEDRMYRDVFIFIANAWGPISGGINSFNYDLARACAREASGRKGCVICCVIPNLTDKIKAEMEREKIIPISLHSDEFQGSDAAQIIINHVSSQKKLRKFFPQRSNVFWVGHDIYTGELAEQCAAGCNGWSIIFHHMDYESYYIYKDLDVDKYREKINKQKRILCGADLVCAVGPKLLKSAQDIVRIKKKLKVLEVYPGISEIEPVEKIANRFQPIVFGRVEKENRVIKQIELAIAAYAKAIGEDRPYHIIGADSRLSVIGYENSDMDALKREVENLNREAKKNSGKLCNVVPYSYITDREMLMETIVSASLAMMLSFHEGFGLVGYEAIAAGIPVIISKNTGLYDFLEQRHFSHLVYGVDIEGSLESCGYSSNDLITVSEALMTIRKEETEYKRKALELRKELLSQRDIYSWEGVAKRFLEQVFEEFSNKMKSGQTVFFSPDDILKLSTPENNNEFNEDCLGTSDKKRIFHIRGKDSLIKLCLHLKEKYASKRYETLIYNIPNEEIGNAYEEFITDCQEYFAFEGGLGSLEWFVGNELANKLKNRILVLNQFPEQPGAGFSTLFSMLEKSNSDFLLFTVLDTDYLLHVEIKPFLEMDNFGCQESADSVARSELKLTKSQELLVKILAHCNRPYSRKLITYVCNGINWHLEAAQHEIFFENIADDESMLLEKGLIEEFSEFSYQSTKRMRDMAASLETDDVVYALGIYKMGLFYAKCYHFNKNGDPQLNWGFISCQYFCEAAGINAALMDEIKKEYENVLNDMRRKCMNTAQYERYIQAIQTFLTIYKEPNDLWIWYNLIHCESICHPQPSTLEMAEEILHAKIEKLDFDIQKNADIYMQFIRLCAELKNDLGYSSVIDNMLERKKQIGPQQKISGVIWSQYITSLITIAIDHGQYAMASRKIKELKNLVEPDNQYPWINACALETTLEIVQYKKGLTRQLNVRASNLEKAYHLACSSLHDSRSQAWINGLLGEYLVLSGKQDGMKKIKSSLIMRRKSGEKTKSYRNWLVRISTMDLSQEVRNILEDEYKRTGQPI